MSSIACETEDRNPTLPSPPGLARLPNLPGASFMKRLAPSPTRLLPVLFALGVPLVLTVAAPAVDDAGPRDDQPHRSPIALALSDDGGRLLTANQTSGTVSLVDTGSGRVLDEGATGEKPAGGAISKGGTPRGGPHRFGGDPGVLDVGPHPPR